MGASIHIPDAQFRRLQLKAKREGTTVHRVVLHCIEKELAGDDPQEAAPAEARHNTPRFPAIPSSRPGSLKLGQEGVYEYIPFP